MSRPATTTHGRCIPTLQAVGQARAHEARGRRCGGSPTTRAASFNARRREH